MNLWKLNSSLLVALCVHEFYPATNTFQLKLGPMTSVPVPGFEGTLGVANKYSDNFFVWILDFNKDGWKDILIIGFPGEDTSC